MALRSAGLRVGHERVLRDGIVSSIHAVDDFFYVNAARERRRELTFDHIWFQTRDPRASIPSIAKALRKDFWHWQEKHTGVNGELEPALLKAMLYWNAWIPHVRQNQPDWTYKLEQMETVWPEIIRRLNLPDSPFPAVEASRFTSGAERTTWEELEALDRGAAFETRKLAEGLGYG